MDRTPATSTTRTLIAAAALSSAPGPLSVRISHVVPSPLSGYRLSGIHTPGPLAGYRFSGIHTPGPLGAHLK